MGSLTAISIVGLGYIGLPLALAFSRHIQVIGLDNDSKRIDQLRSGVDTAGIVDKSALTRSDILFTEAPADITAANIHIITVPTPINNAKQPDLSLLFSATEVVAKHCKKQDIIIYESTVYPGLTEEECIPILETVSGLECGKDFFVAYSPERINPGDLRHTLENTVKIVSAQDNATLERVARLYGMIIKAGVHKASSIKVAEAAKVVENTQRDINIALMNELALIFRKMNIDTDEVLETAGTKWNFLNFKPGLVGGHCIGVDPYYLTHKAMLLDYAPRVILSGRNVNDSMGVYIAGVVAKELIKTGITVKNFIVTILGFSFKENISDIRNTRVFDLVRELESFGINVQIYDPLVHAEDMQSEYQLTLTSRPMLKPANAVILAVIHDEFLRGDWALIQALLEDKRGIVFDVKSVLPRESVPVGITLLRL